MQNWRWTVAGLLALLLLACSGRGDNGGFGNNGNNDSQDNPVPVLEVIEPGAVLVNCMDFTLTARGNDFVNGAGIIFKGEELDTTRVSDSELTCTITREMTQPAGHAAVAEAAQVWVRNPAPGGGDSQALTLKIRKNPSFGASRVVVDGAFWNGLAIGEESRLYTWYTDTDAAVIQWEDKTAAFVICSDDQGHTWSDPVKINLTGAPQYPCLCPGADGRVAAVWAAQIGWTRVFKLSKDHGRSWPAGKQIGNNGLLGMPYSGSATPFQCCFSADGMIHVAFGWNHAETWPDTVYYLRSDDEGKHWQYKQLMDDGFMDIDPEVHSAGYLSGWGNRRTPVIDCADGYVYMMYREHSPQTVRFRYRYHTMFLRSLNNGKTWTVPERISNNRSPDLLLPYFGLKSGPNGALAAMWGSSLRTSDDHGATWKEEKQLYAVSGLMKGMDLAYDGAGNLMVLGRNEGLVYFRRSTDNGVTWSPPIAVTQTAYCDNASLEVEQDGTIYVSWLRNNQIHFVEGVPE